MYYIYDITVLIVNLSKNAKHFLTPASQKWGLLYVFYDSKLNIFGFWTVYWRKQDIILGCGKLYWAFFAISWQLVQKSSKYMSYTIYILCVSGTG